MKSPSIKIAVNKDKSYYRCSCGLSKSQPFCDGSHRDDEKGRKPVHYMSPQDKFISFCTCKKGFLNHTVQIVRFQFKKLISAISSLSNSSLVKISYFTSSFIMLKLSGIFIFLKLYFLF